MFSAEPYHTKGRFRIGERQVCSRQKYAFSSGFLKSGSKIRLLRDGVVIYEGTLGSLKRYKDDVKEVKEGYECGLTVDGYNDIKEGDIVEGFEMVEKK